MTEHGVKTIEEAVDQLTGFWRSATLWAAWELSLADHILAGRDTAEEIAEAERADPRTPCGDTYMLSEISGWLHDGFGKIEYHPTLAYASAILATKV